MSFDNKNLTYDYLFPAIDTSIETIDFTVGAGIEVNPTTTQMTIDLSGGSIDIAFTNNVSFSDVGSYNGFSFTDLTDNLARIVDIDIESPNPKVGKSNLTITDDSVAINLEGTLFLNGEHIILTATFGVDGTNDDDILDGDAANDRIRALEGSDDVNGNNGDDAINGGWGDDTLRGGAGDDTIFGSRGDDDIRGNDGLDRLRGGRGDDEMRGGEGNDVFVFNTGNKVDTIFDFDPNEDIIDLKGWSAIGDYTALLNAAETVKDDVHITAGSDTLIIKGLTKDDLDLSYFGMVS